MLERELARAVRLLAKATAPTEVVEMKLYEAATTVAGLIHTIEMAGTKTRTATGTKIKRVAEELLLL